MTLEERVIVETYTGYCMTSGDERKHGKTSWQTGLYSRIGSGICCKNASRKE